MEIFPPRSQLTLYGYSHYFKLFQKLYLKGRLPKVLLLNGEKGSGKATFIYHYVNWLLSEGEKHQYSDDDYKINEKNSSYKLVQNNIHPNFFLLDRFSEDENIKIDQVRTLIKFQNKTTYGKSIKIILLDNSENLNLNSSNALLKVLEEPAKKTFFFIIHNSSKKILHTIKSRSIEYRIFFDNLKKKEIFEKLNEKYQFTNLPYNLEDSFFYETPGNLLNYLNILNNSNSEISKDDLSTVFYFINNYKSKKDINMLNYASLSIEKFFNKLSLLNTDLLYKYSYKKEKILNLITDFKKYNLDKKNLLLQIHETLKDEKIR